MIKFFIVCLIIAAFVFIKKQKAIYWIPAISVFVDVIPLYLYGTVNVIDNHGAVFLDYFRVLVFLCLSLWILFTKQRQGSVYVYIYGIYIIFRQIFTNEVYDNVKMAISLSVYALVINSAYVFFRTNKFDFKELKLSLITTLCIFLINAIISTSLGFFPLYDYEGSIIGLGSFGLLAQYGIVYIIVFLLSFYKKLKWYDLAIIALSAIFCVLSGKRTLMYLLLLGIVIVFANNYKDLFSSKNLKFLVPIFALLIIGFFSYSYTVKNVRQKASEMNYKEEGRFLEYGVVYNELYRHGNPVSILFGKNDGYMSRFDTVINAKMPLDVKGRVVHSDIAIMLFCTGIVGLVLYLLILINLARRQYRISPMKVNNEFRTAFWAIIIPLLFNLFADSHAICTARAIPYMFLGLCLGAQEFRIVFNKKLLAFTSYKLSN